MTDHSPEIAAAQKCLDDFMAAFNARDLAAFEQTFNFPSVRLASNTLVNHRARLSQARDVRARRPPGLAPFGLGAPRRHPRGPRQGPPRYALHPLPRGR